MPFDGIVTRAITKELKEQLTKGRIDKIYQPTDTELLLTIRNKRTNFPLLISIHPSYARFHLTKKNFQNPEQPPMFCMALRKHLANARIDEIDQQAMERVVIFNLISRDEIGDSINLQLIIEIMGKHSNVVLLTKETNQIINCMKHVPPYLNRYRTLLPGATYKLPPPQNKLNPLTAKAKDVIRRLDFNAGKLERQIVQTLEGFSPFIAKELAHRSHLGSMETYEKQYKKMQFQLCNHEYIPSIYKNKRKDFHVLPIHYLNKVKSFSSTNELIDYFYENKAERDRIHQQVHQLKRFLQNELKKNERKLDIHYRTLQQAKEAEKYKKYGELLTANMYAAEKGMSSIEVIDYYDEDQGKITIPLQTDQTPSENAQRFFTRYRKLVTAEKRAKLEKRKTIAEIEYLEGVLHQLDQARFEDLEDIRTELQEEGYQKQRKSQRRRKRKKPQPEQFISSDGTYIYVGRNNKQNEYVTHRLADKEDIWLHTLDIPGSHVIIKSSEPSIQTLEEAAQLAAYFSKAQQSDSVPVDYTKVKYVRKPRGAKPGFVTYSEEKTLFVTPKKLSKAK